MLRSAVLLWILSAVLVPAPVAAGGQGDGLLAPPLPVRAIELRIVTSARMVCVDAPTIECEGIWLDLPHSENLGSQVNGFRAGNCPGTHNRCRPDFVPGAELGSSLVVDHQVSYLPNASNPTEAQYDATITWNVQAPGVAVDGPLLEESFSATETWNENFQTGLHIPPYGYTNGAAPGCAALEFASLPRDRLIQIGRQAFPSSLCDADATGSCRIEPQPLLVDLQGRLETGCSPVVRFALPNRPVDFGERPSPGAFLDAGDLDQDGDDDLLVLTPSGSAGVDAAAIRPNDGDNGFGPPAPIGLSLPSQGAVLGFADFDGDTRLDVFYTADAGASSTWGIATGNGNGTTGPGSPKGSAYGAPFRTGNFVPGGDLDLIIGDRVYAGTSGSYAPVGIALPAGAASSAISDFDGDGDDEFSFALQGLFDGYVEVYENLGAGTMVQSAYNLGTSSDLLVWEATFCDFSLSFPCVLQPVATGAIDVDGDGWTDTVGVLRLEQQATDGLVVFTDTSFWVVWSRNIANAATGVLFEQGTPEYGVIGRTASPTLLVADVDADDRDDLVSGTLWYRNTGSGGFTGPHGLLSTPQTVSAVPVETLRVRDLDRDGSNEVLVGHRIFDVDAPPACANDVDDDGDGLTDAADPGCVDGSDTTETDAAIACDDGVDNDGDGAVDLADLGCAGPTATNEAPQCQDGLNNDGSVGTDFDGGASVLGAGNADPNGADPQCASFHDDREATTGASCGLGAELVPLLGALALAWRRRGDALGERPMDGGARPLR